MRALVSQAGIAAAWPGALISAALGAAFFFHYSGLTVLDPRNVDWLLARADPSTNYIGWLYYRHESWGFPLGHIAGYLAPMGTSLGYTDSLPLLAMPLKLVAHWLPEPFQFFGAWMLVNCVLQGFFGWLLARTMDCGRWARLGATLLFLASPIMMFRQGGHIALAAHWTLLWALWLYVRPLTAASWWPRLRPWLLLMAVVALIHPYLTAMCGVIALAGLIRAWLIDREGGLRGTALAAAALGGVVLAIWWVTGYLNLGGSAAFRGPGFGDFSLNLNGLVNPLDTSRFVKALPSGPAQYEGYAYLGSGLAMVVALGICAAAARRPGREAARRFLPLVIASLLLVVFALSNRVMLGQRQLLAYKTFWPLATIGDVFRSSGRFMWPVYYALIYGAMLSLGRRLDRRFLAWVLGLAVVFQFAEMSPWFQRRAEYARMTFRSRLIDAEWPRLASHFDRVLTYPPYQLSTQFKDDFRDLATWASANHMSVSAGYAIRMPEHERVALSSRLEQAFTTGRPDPRALYVLPPAEYVGFAAGMADSFACAELDGYVVAHARSSEHRFPASREIRCRDLVSFLDANRSRTVLLAVKDEATLGLDAPAKAWLREAGAGFERLAYRGSYVAVLSGGHVVAQWLNNGSRVEASLPEGSELGSLRLRERVDLMSAGYFLGNDASIRVGGREFCLRCRGINAVVLDAAQEVVESAAFDTYTGTAGISMVPRDTAPSP